MKTRFFVPLCLSVVLVASLLAAGELEGSCPTGNRPGATLLFPYFEVDLDNPAGRTTLIAIHNASDEPALAHAVLWTNWGLPTLTFDIFLPGLGVETLSLRSLLEGRLPDTGLGGVIPLPGDTLPGFPTCPERIAYPPLDGAEIAELRAKHTGQASPADGLCYSGSTGDASLATGYLTIDSMRGCSSNVRLPGHDGYFLEGGLGLADNRNVLSGDFFLIDPGEDFAQGMEAVALVADADRFGVDARRRDTFYRRYADGRDERAPLSTAVRGRYLLGGAFDGDTDLLVWSEPYFTALVPVPCGEAPIGHFAVRFRAEVRTLDGGPAATHDFFTTQRSLRLRVGADDLPAEGFGTIEMSSYLLDSGGVGVPRPDEPLQTWMATVISAEGRFSVGLQAVGTSDLCD